jgi:membrane-associated protease RseP (regulator of RpoE activity)
MRSPPALSVGLAAAFAGALVVGLGWAFAPSCDPGARLEPSLAGRDPAGAAPPTREELDMLRRTVSEQAAAIGALADELALLRGELATLVGVAPGPDAELAAGGAGAEPGDPRAPGAPPADAAAPASAGARPSFDALSLVASGYSSQEAERLRERWERLTLDRLELNNRALREGWLLEPRLQEEHRALDTVFREDVGEEGYDAFLYATGQPNRVRVKEVIARSPASHAGVQPGDVIVSYDGERTFGARDLQLATAQGRRGDLVRIEVVRDGRPLTLRVERGPLGIILQGSAEPPRSAG